METSTHQFRIVCPVMGPYTAVPPFETLQEAESWDEDYADDHRHAYCGGKGHTIERRYIGPWTAMGVETRCPNCRGHKGGTWAAIPCGMCHGRGTVFAPRPVRLLTIMEG